MLIATASLFTVGVMAYIIDFFRYAPRFELTDEPEPLTTRSTGAAPSRA
jgi:nitric oxide reductase subunit B